jgi:type IV pilus assembly protein PilA
MKTRHPNGFTLVEIMIVVVIIGMLAALAIPAFQKIRESSQDKTVLSNARQLAAATDQYMMEYGKSTVSINRLVGITNYVKSLDTVANEVYPTYYTQGTPITVTNVGSARTITYGL